MRPPSDRMRKNVVTLSHRPDPAPGTRPVASTPVEVLTLPCSFQPLGDTGRRQDRRDEHLRLGSEDSWRLFITADAVAELDFPWAHAGDVARFQGRDYTLRGQPVPQRFDEDGSVLSWSLDIDGIT